MALPDSDRDTDRDFAHFVPPPRSLGDATLRVFLGELADARSPVHTFTPLLGAQLDLEPGADLTLDVDRTFEHGVLLDHGSVEVAGTALDVADLAFQQAGCDQLSIANRGDGSARVLLLGGTPFPEQLVMWWNFVGRSHDDIATYRQQWQDHGDRFGSVHGLPRYDDPATRSSPAECDVAAASEPRELGRRERERGAHCVDRRHHT